MITWFKRTPVYNGQISSVPWVSVIYRFFCITDCIALQVGSVHSYVPILAGPYLTVGPLSYWDHPYQHGMDRYYRLLCFVGWLGPQLRPNIGRTLPHRRPAELLGPPLPAWHGHLRREAGNPHQAPSAAQVSELFQFSLPCIAGPYKLLISHGATRSPLPVWTSM